MQIEPKPPTAIVRGEEQTLYVTEGVAPDDGRPESEWGEHVTDDEYRGQA